MANDSVGQVSLDLVLNSKEFETKLNNAVNKATSNINGKMNKGLSGTGALLGKIGKLAAGAFAVGSIVNFSKECLELGSNLAEVQNVVDVTFGSMSSKIDEWAKGSIEAMGLSELSAKKYSSTMGAMLKSMGFTGDAVYDMSTSLTQLAGDMNSFYNIEDAFDKIRSGISGETEPLKQLGINLSVANLEAFALTKGITKSYNSMTQMEQAQLRYNYLLQATADAQGDFARTSNSWANQTRILSENFNKLKASIGQGLINALLPVIRVLNQLMTKLQVLGEMFSNFTAKIFGKAETTTQNAFSGVVDGAEQAASAIGGVADATADAAKKMNKTTFGFDELTTLQAPEEASSGGGVGDVGGLDTSLGNSSNEMKELGEQTPPVESALDRMIAKAKELANIFKTNFFEGLNLTGFEGAIENIKLSVESIKTSFSNIFADGQVLNSFNSFFNSVVSSAGTILGSLVGVGTSVINSLIGSISTYLEDNKDFIKSKLVSIFEVGGELTTNFTSIFSNLSQIISDFFNNPTLQSIGADLIEIVVNPLLTGFDLVGKFISDTFGGINTIIEDNKGKIETALSGLLTFIEPITNSISNTFNSLGTKLSEVYNTHIKPAIDNFTEAWSNLTGNILDNWNTHIQPVLDKLATKFADVMENHISPLINNILELGGELIELVSNFYKNNLEPLIEKLNDFLAPIISSIAETLGGALLDGVSLVSDAFNGLIGIVESVVGFFNDHKLACDLLEGAIAGVAAAIGIYNAKLIATKVSTAALELKTKAITIAQAAWNGVQTAGTAISTGLAVAINAINWPLLLVAAAIGAVIAIGVALWKNWDTVKEKAAQLGEFLSGKFEDIKNWCSEKINAFKENVSNAWNNMTSKIKEKNEEIRQNNEEKWNNIKEACGTVASTIKENLSTSWENLKKDLSEKNEQMRSTISDKWSSIKESVSSSVSTLKDHVSNKWDSMKENISTNAKAAFDIASEKFGAIKETVGNKVELFKEKAISAFENVKNGASNIFTGMKDIISNIFSSLVNIIKTPINGIIGLLNSAIDSINGLSIDVPDWVPGFGGETYGFSLPKIPALANGGYVKANQPQLAMIGDNTKYGEIVAPENKLREIENEGANTTNMYLQQMIDQNKQLINLIGLLLDKDSNVVMDTGTLVGVVNSYNARESRRRG